VSLSAIEGSVQSKVKTSFRTLELVFPEPGVATFVRSRAMKIGLAVVVVVGLALTVGCPLFLIHFKFFELFGRKASVFFMIFFGLVELFMSGTVILTVMAHWVGRPLVFDKNQGRLWRKGRTDPGIGDYALLKDVEAVQICSERVGGFGTFEGSQNSFQAYELNIVMKRPAGVRVAALCHGKRAALYADAGKLAEFLGVPLLDHTEAPARDKSAASG
jgi:hypothetical protein